MGGYAGLATALAFAVEYTKEGSPHGHGLVALCNLYSTNSLLAVSYTHLTLPTKRIV